MIYNDKTFFKGYVFSERPLQIQGIQKKIGSCYLYVDSSLTLHEYKADKHLIMLGYAIDTHDVSISEQELLTTLAACSTEQEFHQLLNRMNGRYLLFINDGDIRIYPDATTMRPIFYYSEVCLLASHSPLLAAIAPIYDRDVKRRGRVNGFLDFSQYEDIYKLSPNMYYDVKTKRPVRFFPENPFREQSLSDALKETLPLLLNQKEWLKTQDAFLTLTAGSDSRVSLALTRNRELPVLTYLNNNEKMSEAAANIYETDVRIVSEMVDDLNLNHTLINIHPSQVPDDYEHLLKQQLESLHSFALSDYLKSSPYSGKLHVKSTIYELAKLPYKAALYKSEPVESLTKIIAGKTSKILGRDFDLHQAVSKYLERNNLMNTDYSLLDLYYVESRMGNWHSNLTQETDNSVEVFVLLNTRDLINAVISMPLEIREGKWIHREWINALWPVLNYYPINNSDSLYDMYKEHEKTAALHRHIHLSMESSLVMIDRVIQPEFPIKQKNHSFIVKNISTERRSISFATHYHNPQGKGSLTLEVGHSRYDYTDINEGINVTMAPGESVKMMIKFKKLYEQPSWQKAARLTVKL